MQLPVGVVVRVPAAGPLLCEPGVEPRRHQPVRALLALGGADGEVVRVLVLGVAGVALDPGPRDGMRGGGLGELLPELDVLDGAALSLPAARLPSPYPFAHTLHEVLRVRDEYDVGVLPLAAN